MSFASRSATGAPHETLSYSTAYARSSPSRCAIHGAACQTDQSFQIEPKYMSTSTSPGSTPASASSASPARTERSLTCSSSAAMCLPRRPNFSTITPSGMPLAAATSAALITRSGRYEAVATTPTRVIATPGRRR